MTAPCSITLETLIAEQQIRRKLGEFARILDHKNWAEIGTVFAEDLRFDYGSGTEESGLAALLQTMRRFLDHCGPTQHLIGSIIIDVDGECAHSQAYVQARHQRADNPLGPIMDSSGDYHDIWRRGPDGWRIIHRRAIWFTHHGDARILQASQGDMN